MSVRAYPAANDDSLPRRRLVTSHRRRHRWLALCRPFVTALATVAVPVAALWWVATSPRFLLSEVEVRGVDRVDFEWVTAALNGLEGQHLLWLPLTAVERQLLTHPWIEAAEIRKSLPNALALEVVERQPQALLRRGKELFYLDAEGSVIDRFDFKRGPADLLLVSGSQPVAANLQGALEVAADLGLADQDWGAGLSEVEVLNEQDYRLYTAGLSYPLLVSAGRVAGGVRSLRRHLAEIQERYPHIEAVDLRFQNRIVIQPAASPPSREG